MESERQTHAASGWFKADCVRPLEDSGDAWNKFCERIFQIVPVRRETEKSRRIDRPHLCSIDVARMTHSRAASCSLIRGSIRIFLYNCYLHYCCVRLFTVATSEEEDEK